MLYAFFEIAFGARCCSKLEGPTGLTAALETTRSTHVALATASRAQVSIVYAVYVPRVAVRNCGLHAITPDMVP